LIVGDKSLFLLELDAKSFKLKHKLPTIKVPQVVLTKENDGLMLIKIPLDQLKKDKGDLILDIPNVIECAIWIATAARNKNIVQVIDSAT
jgi:myosin-1